MQNGNHILNANRIGLITPVFKRDRKKGAELRIGWLIVLLRRGGLGTTDFNRVDLFTEYHHPDCHQDDLEIQQ